MRVLFMGEIPETADYTDPAIPPGMTPEKIHAGIDMAVDDMRGRGWDVVVCMVPPDAEGAAAETRKALAGGRFDVAVLGGGLRMPASRVPLFETLINLLRREAPDTALAFNTGPETTADAAARVTGA